MRRRNHNSMNTVACCLCRRQSFSFDVMTGLQMDLVTCEGKGKVRPSILNFSEGVLDGQFFLCFIHNFIASIHILVKSQPHKVPQAEWLIHHKVHACSLPLNSFTLNIMHLLSWVLVIVWSRWAFLGGLNTTQRIKLSLHCVTCKILIWECNNIRLGTITTVLVSLLT